jgi:hypothetical protein
VGISGESPISAGAEQLSGVAVVGINNFCPQLAIKQENVHPTKIRVSS